ncbi:DNA primase [Gemmata sp.]|uniref:DNA primase n=1 Tax=Gemmata sp. TaxID=1914242 RepID=UPI003F715C49
MPSDPVELTKQIKAASDIVAVVGSYLAVRPAGNVFKALCPFHNDSRPSLDIDPKRQRYKCWACGAHGDSFNFVMHMEKVGFTEARAILAQRAGIKLDEQQSPQDHHRSHLREVMRWAQALYQDALLEQPEGEPARKYLGGRKLSGKTVRDFGLGYASLTGDWLVKHAAADRVPNELLVEVGLIAARDQSRGFYDRFRDRVMFPIHDVRSQAIAFGGRIMPDSPYATRAPKYYNSAETPLFSKSDVLYGLDLARHAGAAAGFLAVVEGYTDVMMAHQCGVPQVVATMGTALNARHVSQLRRYVPKVVLVYDADAGGYTGVDRALEIFVSQDVELAVATLPDGLDPCDLLVTPGGVEVFKKTLASAVDALDFKLNRLLEKDGAGSVDGTRRVVDEVLGVMAAAPAMPSQAAQVKQELIVTRLAHRLGLRQETVWARLGELRREHEQRQKLEAQKAGPAAAQPPQTRRGGSQGGAAPKSDPHYFMAATLVRLLIAEPGLVAVAADAGVTPDEVAHTGIRRILAEMFDAWRAGQVPDLDVLRERLADRPDLFESLVTQAEVGRQLEEREKKLQGVIADFKRIRAEVASKAIKAELQGARSEEQEIELLRRLQQAHKTAG